MNEVMCCIRQTTVMSLEIYPPLSLSLPPSLSPLSPRTAVSGTGRLLAHAYMIYGLALLSRNYGRFTTVSWVGSTAALPVERTRIHEQNN